MWKPQPDLDFCSSHQPTLSPLGETSPTLATQLFVSSFSTVLLALALHRVPNGYSVLTYCCWPTRNRMHNHDKNCGHNSSNLTQICRFITIHCSFFMCWWYWKLSRSPVISFSSYIVLQLSRFVRKQRWSMLNYEYFRAIAHHQHLKTRKYRASKKPQTCQMKKRENKQKTQ